MKLVFGLLKLIVPAGLAGVLGLTLFSSSTPSSSPRIDGVGIDMRSNQSYGIDGIDAQMNMLDSYGVKFIRQEVNWSMIETSQDVYNWSAGEPLDLIFASAHSHGIKVVAVLTGGPIYLATAGQALDQKSLGTRWEKFVEAAVAHFGENVDYWEIGNLVNSNTGISPFLYPLAPDTPAAPDPLLYSKLLRSASKIIKNADANDEVWMGSLVSMVSNSCAMNPLTFMLEVNGAKGWKSSDAVLFEPQRGATAPETANQNTPNSVCAAALSAMPASLSAEVQSLQELARQLGGKPVYLTGLGWSADNLTSMATGRSISISQLESDLLVRATASVMSVNSVPLVFWKVDTTQNPSAANALANLNQELAQAKPLGQVQGQSGSVHEYRFQKGGETLVFAWRIQDGDTPYPVSIAAQEVGAFLAYPADTAGLSRETSTSIPIDASGNATVLLNERPVIFIGKSSDLAENLQNSVSDQFEIWGLELQNTVRHWMNNQKNALREMIAEWFDKAKENAIDWSEEKIQELLP